MKKLFCLMLIGSLAYTAKASLIITNYSSCVSVSIAVHCHDASHSACSLLSNTYSVINGSPLSFSNTSSLGACAVYPSTSLTYTPGNTQDWDGVIFEITDGTEISKGEVGACFGGNYWSSGFTKYFCGHTDFECNMYTSGGNTYVDFGFF